MKRHQEIHEVTTHEITTCQPLVLEVSCFFLDYTAMEISAVENLNNETPEPSP